MGRVSHDADEVFPRHTDPDPIFQLASGARELDAGDRLAVQRQRQAPPSQGKSIVDYPRKHPLETNFWLG